MSPSPHRTSTRPSRRPRAGRGVILSGEFGGTKVAYLGTERELGVVIEVFSGTPGTEKKPDANRP